MKKQRHPTAKALAIGVGLAFCLWPAITLGQSLKVMAYNVLYERCRDPEQFGASCKLFSGHNHAQSKPHTRWENRKHLVFAEFEDYQPDLLGITEMYGCKALSFTPPLIDDVRQRLLPDFGEQFAFALNNCNRFRSWLFFRRERFRKLRGGHFLQDSDKAQSNHRRVVWAELEDLKTQRRLIAATAHLDPRRSPKPSAKLAAQQPLPNRREREALNIRGQLLKVAGGLPIVLMGDFNTKVETQDHTYATLAASFQDTYLALNSNPGASSVADIVTGKLKPRRVDYIFASPQFQILKAGISTKKRQFLPLDLVHDGQYRCEGACDKSPLMGYGSDHLPVTTTLLLKSPAVLAGRSGTSHAFYVWTDRALCKNSSARFQNVGIVSSAGIASAELRQTLFEQTDVQSAPSAQLEVAIAATDNPSGWGCLIHSLRVIAPTSPKR